MSLCHLNLNVLLKICSQNPGFNLAGNKLETPYVGRSLMRPLTPPPRSSTPPSLFPAAEAFEDVPQGFGKSIFFLLDAKSYTFSQKRVMFPMTLVSLYIYILIRCKESLFRRNWCISA